MVQIIRERGFGAELGDALGKGLQALANQKLQQLQRANQAAAFEAAGLPQWLSELPQGTQGNLAAQLFKQQQQQEQMSQLQRLLQGPANQQQDNNFQALLSGQRPSSEQSDNFSNQDAQQTQNAGRRGVNITPEIEAIAAGFGPQASAYVKSLKDRERDEATRNYRTQKLGLEEHKAAIAQNKNFNEELDRTAAEVPEIIGKLNRMEKLVKGGKLYTGGWSYLPSWLQNADSQEFSKLMNDFLSRTTGRLTNYRAQKLLESIPNLMQSKEGQLRVINDLKLLYEMPRIRQLERRKILKAHGGREPFGLADLVEEAAEPKIKKLMDKLSIGDDADEFENAQGFPGPLQTKGNNFDSGAMDEQEPSLNEEMQVAQGVVATNGSPRASRPLAVIDEMITPNSNTNRIMQNRKLSEMQAANQEESFGQSTLRSLSQLGTNAVAGALGTPGNLLDLGFKAANYATGGKVPQYREIQEKLPASFPTSSQIKELGHSYLPEEYKKEKNDFEHYVNEFVSDAASLASPVGGVLNKLGLGKVLSTAAVSNAVPLGLATAGFDKGTQDLSKAITLLAPTLYSVMKLRSAGNKLLDTAKQAGSEVKIRNQHQLEKPIATLTKALNRGELSPGKDRVLESLDDLYFKISHDTLRGSDLVEATKEISKLAKDESISKPLQQYLTQATKTFTNAMAKSGNQAFVKPLERGISILEGLDQSSKIHDILKSSLPEVVAKNLKPMTLAMLGLSGYGVGGKAAAGAALGAGVLEKTYKMLKNPGIQSYLGHVLKAAAQRRGPNLVKLISQLDRKVAQEEEKQSRVENKLKNRR